MLINEQSEVYKSCSVQWRNGFYVFGGSSNKRQISKVDGCQLRPIGSLAFDHYTGGCSVMNDAIYLCFNVVFNSGDYKRCRSATEPTENFTQIPLSTFDHRWARTASSNSKLIVLPASGTWLAALACTANRFQD